MRLKRGALIDWKGKSGTKCLKEKDRCIKNYVSLYSFKGKFRSEEFSRQVGSADKVGDRNFLELHSKSLHFNPIATSFTDYSIFLGAR